MANNPVVIDNRSAPRIEVEQAVELLADDGTPHPATLLDLSNGGGQVLLTRESAQALGLPQVRQIAFRLWLPGELEDLPLQGDAGVIHWRDDGESSLRVGLAFGDLADGARLRIESFVTTCLRYAE